MTKLNEEKYALITEHTAYAKALAREMTTNVVDYEEMEQEAMARLCEAAAAYEGRNGAQFRTFAYEVIRFGLLKLIENFRRHGITNRVDIDSEEFNEEDECGEMPFVEFEKREMIGKLLKSLDYQERFIVQMHYGLVTGVGMSLEAIGEMLGTGKQDVHNRVRRAIRKMRRVNES